MYKIAKVQAIHKGSHLADLESNDIFDPGCNKLID